MLHADERGEPCREDEATPVFVEPTSVDPGETVAPEDVNTEEMPAESDRSEEAQQAGEPGDHVATDQSASFSH